MHLAGIRFWDIVSVGAVIGLLLRLSIPMCWGNRDPQPDALFVFSLHTEEA